MKMMYGGTPVKNLMLHTDSDDATMVASDLQAGVTAYSKGKKVTGTGKVFSFAFYGTYTTNNPLPIPSVINVIEVASVDYPVQSAINLRNMKTTDFSVEQNIGSILIEGTSYPLTVNITNNNLTITSSTTVELDLFIGKDDYV